MKILITGAGGLLGQEVWKLLEQEPEPHELFAFGRSRPSFLTDEQWIEGDITNAARTFTTITKLNPEVIIHCAAYNQVDKAETEPDEAYKVNGLGVRNLALACQRFDATLLAVSTDYVFSGENAPEGGYREFDHCQPMNRYGESKRWGEIFVQQLLNKFFIVRTAWLFGPSRPTWVDAVASYSAEGKPVIAAKDMVGCPTYTPDLAEAIVRLAKSRHYGIYHLTNSGACSRVELAKEVLRLYKRADYPHLKVVKRTDLKLPAPRPDNSALDNLAWRLDGFTPLRPWQEALRDHFARRKVSTR